MEKGEASTLLGGILAIVAMIGVVICAVVGREVPDVLGLTALLAAAWYWGTATPAVVSALAGKNRAGKGDDDTGGK